MQSTVRGPNQGFGKVPDGKLPSVAELLSAAENHGVDVDVSIQCMDAVDLGGWIQLYILYYFICNSNCII